jgi:magnesium-transporting ATPase (P-type)
MNPSPYTYVEMSLTVPWTLYFVFLACVTIPFVVMIIGRGAISRFVRYVLPLILAVVFAVVALFVFNAFEATHLMKTEKRAGPTTLSR